MMFPSTSTPFPGPLRGTLGLFWWGQWRADEELHWLNERIADNTTSHGEDSFKTGLRRPRVQSPLMMTSDLSEKSLRRDFLVH
jgi:hypothetical protein